jgi:ABC-type Fe3+-citrate transport system substrate-binding protein
LFNLSLNSISRIPEEQLKMENPEKLATQGTQEEEKQTKTQHNKCWTPLYANKLK